MFVDTIVPDVAVAVPVAVAVAVPIVAVAIELVTDEATDDSEILVSSVP